MLPGDPGFAVWKHMFPLYRLSSTLYPPGGAFWGPRRDGFNLCPALLPGSVGWAPEEQGAASRGMGTVASQVFMDGRGTVYGWLADCPAGEPVQRRYIVRPWFRGWRLVPVCDEWQYLRLRHSHNLPSHIQGLAAPTDEPAEGVRRPPTRTESVCHCCGCISLCHQRGTVEYPYMHFERDTV